ncbi:hypothetical protein PPERSA_10414 [Pseudocohnilembus persalinus]|uniref:Transmembrane protein n=1 Tax=Pseudocohnilembus persalinus TaxID=266149 RepID=A0A0V0QW13_PSEPJ|nr:hypothetical protein PPERSA_10414 [Pseudocohnilembus persalinus]|eukprot:KRX06556.1 hypothetical protein PPERSA_10414 [Pseudocohnilembus persalinus]
MRNNSLQILLVAILFVTLNNFCQCYIKYDVNKVSEWKSNDITDSENFKVQNTYSNQNWQNSQSLKLSDSKIVMTIFGQRESKSKNILDQQLAVFDNKGNIVQSLVFENVKKYQTALSLTNVKGEFLFVYSDNVQIYMTFYDEELQVKRGSQNQQLVAYDSEKDNVQPIISVGKDLIYIQFMVIKDKNLILQVYVLDLSDQSKYTIQKTHTYSNYKIEYIYANSIQAYNDNTAIVHYFAKNDKDEDTLVQLKYDSKGSLKSGYPKELDIDLNLETEEVYWRWYSILHEDQKTSTFLASNNNDDLMIYTFGKDGKQICQNIYDLKDYLNYNYYYDIHGDQGWLYLQDKVNKEGHFTLFDPKNCSVNLKKLSGTEIFLGLAGSFLDQKNREILMIELGSLKDSTKQESYQGMMYKIGKFENKKDDDDNQAVIVGVQFLGFIIGILFLI